MGCTGSKESPQRRHQSPSPSRASPSPSPARSTRPATSAPAPAPPPEPTKEIGSGLSGPDATREQTDLSEMFTPCPLHASQSRPARWCAGRGDTRFSRGGAFIACADSIALLKAADEANQAGKPAEAPPAIRELDAVGENELAEPILAKPDKTEEDAVVLLQARKSMEALEILHKLVTDSLSPSANVRINYAAAIIDIASDSLGQRMETVERLQMQSWEEIVDFAVLQLQNETEELHVVESVPASYNLALLVVKLYDFDGGKDGGSQELNQLFPEEAERLARNAAGGFGMWCGAGHPYAYSALSLLSLFVHAQGRIREAVSLARKVEKDAGENKLNAESVLGVVLTEYDASRESVIGTNLLSIDDAGLEGMGPLGLHEVVIEKFDPDAPGNPPHPHWGRENPRPGKLGAQWNGQDIGILQRVRPNSVAEEFLSKFKKRRLKFINGTDIQEDLESAMEKLHAAMAARKLCLLSVRPIQRHGSKYHPSIG